MESITWDALNESQRETLVGIMFDCLPETEQ